MKKAPLVLLITLATSCSQIQDKNFGVKSLDPVPSSGSSGKPVVRDPNLLSVNPPAITFKEDDGAVTTTDMKPSKFIVDRKALYNPNKNFYADGMITVIYKNNYNLKVNKNSSNLSSSDSNVSSIINSILKSNNIEHASSLLYEDDPKIDEYKKIQNELSSKFNQDFPSLQSIHYYSFPKDTDVIKLAEQLRSLPFVDTAYPTPIGHTDSTPNPNFISRQTISNIHTTLPSYTNDPNFGTNYAENIYWSWFNHHKIFQAWDIYKQNFGNVADISLVLTSDKPVIAVVDNGFYKGADADHHHI